MADYSDLKNRFQTDDIPSGSDYGELIQLAGDAKDKADAAVPDNGDGTITVNGKRYKPVEDNNDDTITVNGKQYKPVEDNKDNTITINGSTFAPVKDNQDGTITVNTQRYTPADYNKVVKDNKDNTITVNGKTYVPVADNQDNTITVNGKTYVPADASKVVIDNHDGTVVLNGLNKRLATPENAVMTDIGKLTNVNIVRDYNYIGESKDINEFKESINSDVGFKILYVTDMHYGEGTNDSGTASIDKYRDYVKAPPLSKLMLKNLAAFDMAVNASVWNGDLIHGHEKKDINEMHNISISRMIRGVMPNTDAFIGIGNHEDGTVWNYQEPINKEELLSEYDYDNNSFGETRNGFAAYKDYDDSKIRIVHIAGYDNPDIYNSDGSEKYPRGSHSVFAQDQLNFILACLNSVPDGYTVLIFNHGPLLGFFGNTPYSSTYNVNHDLLNGMLSAFAKHESYSGTGTNADYPASISCDFSKSTATLAGIITGHEHRDKAVQEINGVKSVMRTCFLAADRGGEGVATSTTDDDLGTKQQYAFDIIEVDTANRKVSFKRFGKGDNYEYEY